MRNYLSKFYQIEFKLSLWLKTGPKEVDKVINIKGKEIKDNFLKSQEVNPIFADDYLGEIIDYLKVQRYIYDLYISLNKKTALIRTAQAREGVELKHYIQLEGAFIDESTLNPLEWITVVLTTCRKTEDDLQNSEALRDWIKTTVDEYLKMPGDSAPGFAAWFSEKCKNGGPSSALTDSSEKGLDNSTQAHSCGS